MQNIQTKKRSKKSILCVVDTETTGLYPFWNELIQLAIVPLNDDFTPHNTIKPFIIECKPKFPERFSEEAASKNGLKEKCMNYGSKEDAVKAFIKWSEDNNIYVMPLAQNWIFDREMINAWLGKNEKGKNQLGTYFGKKYKDLLMITDFLDDLCFYFKGKRRFEKQNLEYLCEQLNIDHGKHDAYEDCICTAKCYVELMKCTKKLMDVSEIK